MPQDVTDDMYKATCIRVFNIQQIYKIQCVLIWLTDLASAIQSRKVRNGRNF